MVLFSFSFYWSHLCPYRWNYCSGIFNDKLTFLKIAIRKKDLNIIGIILSYIRKWESSDFSQIEVDIYDTFSNNYLNIIENAVSDIPWDFINSPIIKYNNKPDYINIVKLIDKITIAYTNEFIQLIKSCFPVKIDNPKTDKDNDKNEDDDENEDEDDDENEDENKDEDNDEIINNEGIKIVTRSNIIPPSYMGTSVIETYVKKQFKIHYQKKLEETEKLDNNNVQNNKLELINPVTQLGSRTTNN